MTPMHSCTWTNQMVGWLDGTWETSPGGRSGVYGAAIEVTDREGGTYYAVR
jgi:hypothetical protein